MEDILHVLLSLAMQGIIPAVIGYCEQMALLKKGKEPSRRGKLRWIFLSVMVVVILSVAGMLLIPAMEEVCAILYLFSFWAAIISAAFGFGRWAARSDFRRKQK